MCDIMLQNTPNHTPRTEVISPPPGKTPAPVAFDEARTRTDLFAALLRAKQTFGASKIAAVDGDGSEYDYKTIVRGAFALGRALCTHTRRGEHVGLLLPTGIGAVLGFFALSAFNRVPAMLNFTAGTKNLKAALKAAEGRTILTARKFIELGELHDLIDELSETANIIYLEDIRETLDLKAKLAGGLGPLMPGLFRRRAKPDSTGVVLFTSGTEGDPKGVVLSHRNVLANVEQVRAHIGLDSETDSLFNPLPTFHCFGLTVGAILPLIAGIRVVFHPSPLQPRDIARRIRASGTTILIATDTFISQ